MKDYVALAYDPYDIADAYRGVLLRLRERQKEEAASLTARLLGKNQCYGCKVFLDKPHIYCDDCIPF